MFFKEPYFSQYKVPCQLQSLTIIGQKSRITTAPSIAGEPMMQMEQAIAAMNIIGVPMNKGPFTTAS